MSTRMLEYTSVQIAASANLLNCISNLDGIDCFCEWPSINACIDFSQPTYRSRRRITIESPSSSAIGFWIEYATNFLRLLTDRNRPAHRFSSRLSTVELILRPRLFLIDRLDHRFGVFKFLATGQRLFDQAMRFGFGMPQDN